MAIEKAGPGYQGEMKVVDHYCSCSNCCWWLDSKMPRLGSHHVAVRFHEYLDATTVVDRFRLGGERVEMAHCYEAITGEHGVAWLIRQPPHLCERCVGQVNRGVCCTIEVGSFRLRVKTEEEFNG